MAGQSGISEPTLPERQALTTVLKFLKKKNLKDTEEMLRKELGVHSDMELDEFNSLSGAQHSRETEPLKYDESYSSPFPILVSHPPPLTKATSSPAPFAPPSLAIQSNKNYLSSSICSSIHLESPPVLLTAASGPSSPPKSVPPLPYNSGVDAAEGSGIAGSEEPVMSLPLFGKKCPTLQPAAALPTSTSAGCAVLPLPPFLYQFAPSLQGGLISAAAASATLPHQPPMIASICALHPGSLVNTPAYPFSSAMGASYSVLVGTPAGKESPSPAVEDDKASPTSSTSLIFPSTAEVPAVSSTQPHLNSSSAVHSISLKGSAQVLAAIPPEEYTPAFMELKQFAEDFKTRRIRLGYTQGGVGQSLAERGYSNFAQSTISRFEQLQLSPTNAAAIKQILEKWLQEAESPLSNPCDSGKAAGMNNCRKRKKRAVFTPQTKAVLEDHFAFNPRPNRATIEMLSGKLDLLPEEIRVWFCNKRQKTKQSSCEDCSAAASEGGNWCDSKARSASTAESVGSRSTSPSQMSCSEVRCRNSPSPKTSFTIEELSKSSLASTPGSGASSPCVSSPPVIFSPYDVSPTLVGPQGVFSSLPFFVSKLLVAPPPVTQPI